MNLQIIDRRLAGKNKSIVNVERFHRRFQQQIKKAAEEALKSNNIGDIKGTDVQIDSKDIKQPIFGHAARGGNRETVHPGNTEYLKGDKIKRPPQNAQSKKGGKPGDGDGDVDQDDFVFHLSREDILKVLFDGLKLPNMVKEHLLAENTHMKSKNAGIVSSGTPNNLHIVRSLRGALARRIALDSPREREIANLQIAFAKATNEDKIAIQLKIDELEAKPKSAYIDPIDLKYRNRVRVPVPQAKAVIFRLMDVSSSMQEKHKSDAKMFYTLLGMFTEKEYDHVDIVNIRYHALAKECNEHDFFYGNETGGTHVSNAFELMKDIIEKRYPLKDWNIYGGLASDGDTGPTADDNALKIIAPEVIKMCQHFWYIELAERDKELGGILTQSLAGAKNFSMKRQVNRENLYTVFRELLKDRGLSSDQQTGRRLAAMEATPS